MSSTKSKLTSLQRSLNYLHVDELKTYCKKLELSQKGTKPTLTSRIMHFLKTGEKTETPSYPAVSCAKGRNIPEIKCESLMLKGGYKIDLKTRIFFKSLIGDYFHFTAFGIDWLKEQWMKGKPPTYKKFADMWKKEYAYRQENGSSPKTEWAYIIFVKEYTKNNPHANTKEILSNWQTERLNNKELVDQFFIQHFQESN